MINYTIIGILLFSIGLFGALTRKEMLRIFISIEIMIGAVNLILAAFLAFSGSGSAYQHQTGNMVSAGLVFLFFVWLFAVANAVVGLPLFLLIRAKIKTQNTQDLRQFHG